METAKNPCFCAFTILKRLFARVLERPLCEKRTFSVAYFHAQLSMFVSDNAYPNAAFDGIPNLQNIRNLQVILYAIKQFTHILTITSPLISFGNSVSVAPIRTYIAYCNKNVILSVLFDTPALAANSC